MQNLSYENEFDLHENEPVEETYFHMNGFAQKLVLTRRQKATWEWPVKESALVCNCNKGWRLGWL